MSEKNKAIEIDWYTIRDARAKLRACPNYAEITEAQIVEWGFSGKLRLYALQGGTEFELVAREDIAQIMAGGIGAHNLPVSFFNLRVPNSELNRIIKAAQPNSITNAQPAPLPQSDKIDPRKEKTYLQIIRLMAAELDLPKEPFKAADALMEAAVRRGLMMPAKRDTIANKLKDAANLSD